VIVFGLFAIGFVLLWLLVTTLLGLLAGWFELVARFPDRADQPIAQFRHQSGTMGLLVRMHGVLTFSV